MKRKIFVVLCAAVAVSMLLTGCACRHKWKDATCTEPKTCEKCGETEGEPLGHDFLEATCEEPRRCQRCDFSEGEKLEHVWAEATPVKPKECVLCGKTEGGAEIDGTWERKLEVGAWQYVIDTGRGTYLMVQVGKNYSDKLGEYEIHAISDTRLSDGTYIMELTQDGQLKVTDTDSGKQKFYTRKSAKTTAVEYDNTGNGSTVNKNVNRHDDATAFSCAKEIVKAELKNPSTATFCQQSESKIYHLGNGTYCVAGWVDAENSYGMEVRTEFIVTYDATENGYKNAGIQYR